jgi:hypothetical protein
MALLNLVDNNPQPRDIFAQVPDFLFQIIC